MTPTPEQMLKVKKKNMSPYVMGNEKLEMIPISHYLMGNGAITQTAKKKAADFSLILMNALNCIEFLIKINEKSVALFLLSALPPVTRDH